MAGRFDYIADLAPDVSQIATGFSTSLVRLSENSQSG